MKNKRYIIKKYVIAGSAEEAIKKERKLPIDEILFDYDYRDSPMGFSHERSGRTDKV